MADDELNNNEKPPNPLPTPPATDSSSTLSEKEKHVDISKNINEQGEDDEIKIAPKREETRKPSFDVQQSPTVPEMDNSDTDNNNNNNNNNTMRNRGRISLDVPHSPVGDYGTRQSHSMDERPGLRRSFSTVVSVYAPLPFHLREHKLAVGIVTAIVVVDHGILPPVLYFGLEYGTNLGDQTIFAIVTSVFGIVFGLDTCWRLYKLWRKDGAYRPEGLWRWGVDYFQISFCSALLVNVAFIVAGTSVNPPLIRMLALPMPLIIFQFSWQLLLSQYLRHLDIRTPFRMSSVSKGEKWPLVLYLLIEDVIAVDANGGNEWRRRWRKRYESSKDMRMLVEKLSLFWGVGGVICSAVCVALIFAVDGKTGKEVGYALGWLGPWLWVIPAAVFTTYYVKRSLKEEKDFPIEVVEC